MLKNTKSFAETTDLAAPSDVLSDVLRSLRIRGSLLLKEDYTPPWAVSIPREADLAALLGIPPDIRVAAFHLVRRGHIELKLSNGNEAVVQAGEMVVCFAGDAHQLSQGTNPQVLPFAAIKMGSGNVFQPDKTNRDRSTSLVCGIFLLRDTVLNPLFATLPPLLHTVVSRPDGLPTLSGVADLLVREVNRQTPGSRYAVERLLELLCAEAIRSHVETTEPAVGWLQGLRDPVVGRAITLIHSQPGENWSVQRLARHVAISPSRFAARFTSTLGESPMAYVTKWRMHVASALLHDAQRSIEQIAATVGYENPAAFSRTFKRHLGLPPAAWRASRRI